MAKLIYASNVSLDGCTEDERGAFDWATPDDDVFAFITDLMRSAGTYLYGRRGDVPPAEFEAHHYARNRAEATLNTPTPT